MCLLKELKDEIANGWLGILFVLGLALFSRFFYIWITHPVLGKSISDILIAILIGLIIGNAFQLSKEICSGAKFAIQRLLRLGIILLGLRLSLQDVAATGLTALVLVIICISAALLLAYFAGWLFKVTPKLAILIGIGTAICGNTAIIATAPIVEADEEEMGFAIATITLFGMLAVLLYPLIGHLIGLSDRAFGLWAGTAVNDTSQVVAVGAMYSELSLDIATIVKLTRNTLMVPLMVLLGLFYSQGLKKAMSATAVEASRFSWNKLVPGFVLGFLLMAMLRTMGVAVGFLPLSVSSPGELQNAATYLKTVDETSKFLILMALTGVGLNTDLTGLRRLGIKPLIIGTFVAIMLAAISLSLILFTPLGS